MQYLELVIHRGLGVFHLDGDVLVSPDRSVRVKCYRIEQHPFKRGKVRTDVWFMLKGRPWHGVQDDSFCLVHCKAMKAQLA